MAHLPSNRTGVLPGRILTFGGMKLEGALWAMGRVGQSVLLGPKPEDLGEGVIVVDVRIGCSGAGGGGGEW